MKEVKPEVGGWVRCLKNCIRDRDKDYNQFKAGEYYQITSIDNSVVVCGVLRMYYTNSDSSYGLECEYLGMEKPDGDYSIF